MAVQAVLVGIDDEHRRRAEEREALADHDPRADVPRRLDRRRRRFDSLPGSRIALGLAFARRGRTSLRASPHRQMRARLPADPVAARGLGADSHRLVGVGLGGSRPRRFVRRARRQLDGATQAAPLAVDGDQRGERLLPKVCTPSRHVTARPASRPAARPTGRRRAAAPAPARCRRAPRRSGRRARAGRGRACPTRPRASSAKIDLRASVSAGVDWIAVRQRAIELAARTDSPRRRRSRTASR